MGPGERAGLQTAMVALAEGDRAAFDVVYALLWPMLRRVAIGALGSAADGEDAAQQALVKLFARAVRFDTERDALPWALAFVVNECRSVRNRRQRRRGAGAVPESVPDPQGTPEGQYAHRQLIAAIESAVRTLSPNDRQALGLGAAPADLNAATARKRKQRALGRLRAAWRRVYGAA